MKLATTVKASFVSKRQNHGVSCWCTQAASMECGKFPKVPSPVLGTHATKGMWIHNCFKAFEYGNGDGTMQTKIFSVSLAKLWANACRDVTLQRRQQKNTIVSKPPNAVNTSEHLQTFIFPGKIWVHVHMKMHTAPQRHNSFFSKRSQPLARFPTRRGVYDVVLMVLFLMM